MIRRLAVIEGYLREGTYPATVPSLGEIQLCGTLPANLWPGDCIEIEGAPDESGRFAVSLAHGPQPPRAKDAVKVLQDLAYIGAATAREIVHTHSTAELFAKIAREPYAFFSRVPGIGATRAIRTAADWRALPSHLANPHPLRCHTRFHDETAPIHAQPPAASLHEPHTEPAGQLHTATPSPTPRRVASHAALPNMPASVLTNGRSNPEIR